MQGLAALAALSLSMGLTAPALAQPSFNAEQWTERNVPDYVRNIPDWRERSSYPYRFDGSRYQNIDDVNRPRQNWVVLDAIR